MNMGRRDVGGKDTPQVIVIRRLSLTGMKTCAERADPASMLAPEEVAAAADVSTRTIYRRVEGQNYSFRGNTGENKFTWHPPLWSEFSH